MKKFAAMFLALAMVASLSACGGNGSSSGSASSGGASSGGASSGGADLGEYALKTQITSTDKITIRISSDASEIHPSEIVLEECFKAPLEAASNGNITVEIYPNSMLGSLTENVNSMQMGDLEMAYLNDSILSGFIPEFAVVGLPYLFTSVDAVHNAMAGEFGETLSEKLESQLGIVNLGWCDVGFRNLTNSKRPITSVEDLKGLKIAP
ncbi:TRAP transporter substrate-binding protein [Oscillibacter sp. MSJ-2]|uniref:TRAP transporter substrate-binding protein n=1 Tax=Dysosmobacter acutus TaxID=2841504 RepID=A0ABS6F5L5_9FIRM|nr:TRAP transporter substrate-binding protein [Dysosmobacter acutus]